MPKSFPILIAPSEALLLGLCVGKYQEALADDASDTHFFSILKQHLAPYFSETRRQLIYKRIPIPNEKPSIPIGTRITSDKYKSGYRHVYVYDRYQIDVIPNRRIILVEHKPFSGFPDTGCVILLKESRGCLFDQIIDLLRPVMRQDLQDFFDFPNKSIEDLEDAITSGSALVSLDDSKEIIARCTSIARENNCQLSFEAGQKFGELSVKVDSFKQFTEEPTASLEDEYARSVDTRLSHLGNQLDSALEQLETLNTTIEANATIEFIEARDARIAALEERVEQLERDIERVHDGLATFVLAPTGLKSLIHDLLSSEIVQQCFYTTQLLMTFDQSTTALMIDWDIACNTKFVRVDKTTGEPVALDGLEWYEPEYHEALKTTKRITTYSEIQVRMQHAVIAVWQAFGDLLGSLRFVDHEAWLLDSGRYLPGAIVIASTDTPDALHEKLNELQQSLYDAKRQNRPVREVMLIAVPYIEALTKRIFPEEFVQSKFSVARILDAGTEDKDPNRKEFARLALHLHRTYRNPLVHQIDEREFTEIEARFFILGLMRLVELWNKICWP